AACAQIRAKWRQRHRVVASAMKIYTKTGDQGETGLFDGTRVSKADARVEAYGAVDELNAWLGLARSHQAGDRADAMLADPRHRIAARVEKAALGEADVTRLEHWIDELDATMPALRRFILAGGSP